MYIFAPDGLSPKLLTCASSAALARLAKASADARRRFMKPMMKFVMRLFKARTTDSKIELGAII